MKCKSLLAMVLVLCLCGCGSDPFDVEKDGILNIIMYDKQTETFFYETVGPDGQHMETAEFESSELTVLYADSGSFQSSVRDGKVVNELVSVDVYDDAGNMVVPDATVTAIFTQTAAIHDHAIYALQIILCEGRYFPVVELDAELAEPGIVYYFNTETQTMTALYRYSNAVVGGLQIANPENLP